MYVFDRCVLAQIYRGLTFLGFGCVLFAGLMAGDSHAEQEVRLAKCKLCGLNQPQTEGRVHGSFKCYVCLNIEQTMRRNLGTTMDMKEWSQEDLEDFFRKVASGENGRISWRTIKANLVKTLTERSLSRHTASVTCEKLPLSVYVTRGWSEATVKHFPTEWSEAYGEQVYKVPIEGDSWQEVKEEVEERVLQLERTAAARGKAKKDMADLDLPRPEPASGADAKEAKAQAAQEKKVSATNDRIVALASKALGSLVQAETSGTKLLARASKAGTKDESAQELLAKTVSELQDWAAKCRLAVNQQENNKNLPEGSEQKPLDTLPFDHAALKVKLQTFAASSKSLRDSLPKPQPKAKEASEGTKKTKAGDENVPNKRARTKGPQT